MVCVLLCISNMQWYSKCNIKLKHLNWKLMDVILYSVLFVIVAQVALRSKLISASAIFRI